MSQGQGGKGKGDGHTQWLPGTHNSSTHRPPRQTQATSCTTGGPPNTSAHTRRRQINWTSAFVPAGHPRTCARTSLNPAQIPAHRTTGHSGCVCGCGCGCGCGIYRGLWTACGVRWLVGEAAPPPHSPAQIYATSPDIRKVQIYAHPRYKPSPDTPQPLQPLQHRWYALSLLVSPRLSLSLSLESDVCIWRLTSGIWHLTVTVTIYLTNAS